jgi:vitamin B12 transporter
VSLDGGNLGTLRSAASLAGAAGRFDYFSEYSHLSTDNNLPHKSDLNNTYAGRFGVRVGHSTDISGTLRHIRNEYDNPNAFSAFRIADDSSQRTKATFAGVAVASQWTDRLQTTARFGSSDQQSSYLNPTPSGEAFDPFGFGSNYLGRPVTLVGANGYRVSGQAILDFGGSYPSLFESRTTRRTLSGAASFALLPDISVSAGGRVEREQGFDDPQGEPTITRDNGNVFVEGRISLGRRTFVSGGVGYDRNEAFVSAFTPRVSVATYVRNPSQGLVGGTKVSFNAGKGIKAPAVFQEQSSVFMLLQSVPNAPTVKPISPETGTSVDVAVEQALFNEQARVHLGYFHNSYRDVIEFVSKNVLPQLGIPAAAAQATPFGAYVNSQSYDAQGIELSAEALLARRLRLMASYTFLDAEVSQSFSSDALTPARNPAFPDVAIGAFSPLVGERPFRRPAHSGTVLVGYIAGPAQVTLSAFFSGIRDDSTFLTDAFFGNSMLLPNQGLDAAYQKVDLSGAYALHRHLRAYVSIENLFDEQFEAAFGYPSLSRTARAGVTVTFGGRP